MEFRTAVALGVLWIGALGCEPSGPTSNAKSKAATELSGPLEGLRKATSKEYDDTVVKTDGSVPVYDEQGNELTIEYMIVRYSVGDVELDLYVDEGGEPGAIVVRPLTEQQQALRRRQHGEPGEPPPPSLLHEADNSH